VTYVTARCKVRD